jgi:hypothetical protein
VDLETHQGEYRRDKVGRHGQQWESVWRIARLLRAKGEQFIVLVAYLDESYDDKVFTIGGFLAYEEVWRDVEKKWKGILLDNDIGRFHAADCSSGYGEFKGWPPRRRTGLMKRLLRILIRPEMYGLFFGVVVPAHKELFRLKQNDDFYLACLQLCMETLERKTALLPAGERIAMIADMSKWKAKGQQLFVEMTDRNEKLAARLKTITYANWTDFVPLQCADLMAYESFKMVRQREFDPDRPERKSFTELSSKLPIFGGHLDRDCLERLRQAISADPAKS